MNQLRSSIYVITYKGLAPFMICTNVFKSPNRLIEQWVDQTTNRD